MAYFDSAACHKPLAVIEPRPNAWPNATATSTARCAWPKRPQAYEAAETVRLNAASTRCFCGWHDRQHQPRCPNLGSGQFDQRRFHRVDTDEHHSNIVPWQMLAQERGVEVLVVELNEDGTLDGDMFEAHLTREPKLVALPTCPTRWAR